MTVKQKLFIEHYISNGFNATKAALSAGYSKRTARAMGCENLAKPYIKIEISKKIAEYLSDTEKATLKIINRLDEVIDCDLGDYADIENYDYIDIRGKEQTGTRVVFNETEKLNTRVISEISESKDGAIKIKLHDPLRAIELKGKYLQIWNEGVMMMKKENRKDILSRDERRDRILSLTKKLGKK